MSQKLLLDEYIEKVLTGEIIASKKVQLACKRHLKDLDKVGSENFPWVFNEEKALRPLRFIKMFCITSKGDSTEIQLLHWHHFVIGSIYGWVHKETGIRRFKEATIMLGRKNGKSLIGSGLAIYGASKDGENGADIHLLANSMKQARVVFDECTKMIKASEYLKPNFRTLRDAIHYDEMFSKIEPQAADSEKLDGLSSHLSIYDELHESKDYKLINVMRNSMASRKQPLLLFITTAGYQLDGPLVNYYEQAHDILNGDIVDDRTFYFIAELDDQSEFDKPEMWVKANPNIGVSMKLENMIEEWKKQNVHHLNATISLQNVLISLLAVTNLHSLNMRLLNATKRKWTIQ